MVSISQMRGLTAASAHSQDPPFYLRQLAIVDIQRGPQRG